MAESKTPLCLVCYKPMMPIELADVHSEAAHEIACGLSVNFKMAESHGWIWCADCNCYSHLPTILRLLKEFRDMTMEHFRDARKKGLTGWWG